ncbi:MAG: hypothetical protein JWO36_5472 [Myxococcales bacterium]|nr:hypothetical protein [Myxococcales bacterium]
MDCVQELVGGGPELVAMMAHAWDPELEVEMELELVFDDYEIVEFVDAPTLPILLDDCVEIEYVMATEDDGWFFASEEAIATLEDVLPRETRPKWQYAVAAGFVLALCASAFAI